MELLIGLAVLAGLFYLVNKAVTKKTDDAEAAPYKVETPEPVAPAATVEVVKEEVAVKLRQPGTPKKPPAPKKPAVKKTAVKKPAAKKPATKKAAPKAN